MGVKKKIDILTHYQHRSDCIRDEVKHIQAQCKNIEHNPHAVAEGA